MGDKTIKILWVSVEDASTYLIPIGQTLETGNLTLVALDGDEIAVDANAVAPFRVEAEIAEKSKLEAVEEAIDPVHDVMRKTAEKWREEGDTEIADLLTMFLNDSPESPGSDSKSEELSGKIPSGDIAETIQEVFEEMQTALAQLPDQANLTLENIIEELMKIARPKSSEKQDWEQLQTRIKDNLDQKLKEGFLKDGFPEDYSRS